MSKGTQADAKSASAGSAMNAPEHTQESAYSCQNTYSFGIHATLQIPYGGICTVPFFSSSRACPQAYSSMTVSAL